MKQFAIWLLMLVAGLMLTACSQNTTTDEMGETTEITTDDEMGSMDDMEEDDMDGDMDEMDDEGEMDDMDIEVDATAEVYEISGVNFAFSETDITVAAGTTVTINFTSVDGFHDWVVDEFDAATDKVNPEDGMTSVTFVADTAGTYEFYCSVGQHRANGMVGTLTVTE